MKVYILTHDGIVNETVELYDYLQPKYWATADITVLGYKSPTYKSNIIKFDSLGKDNGHFGVPKQLHDYFTKINCTSFIFGVDDTPFISTVDIEVIDIMKGILELNDSVGRIGLTSCNMTRPHEFISEIRLGFVTIDGGDYKLEIYRDKRHEGNTYRLSGTWSLWNSKYFLLYLDKSDTLFEWEIQASSFSLRADRYEILSTNPPAMNHAHMIKNGQFKDTWKQEATFNKFTMEPEVINKIEQIFNLDKE